MATESEQAPSTVWDEWETFRNVGHFVNHWSRPGWTERTESYHWFLTFEKARNLHHLAEQCQAHLDDVPTLDPVPPKLLHLTLERLGFTSDLAPDELDTVIGAARSSVSTLSPFSLRVGPLTGSPGAVRFSVTPHEPIKKLRQLLIEARSSPDEETDGPTAEPVQYVPHVSIAYSNTDATSEPIVQRVEGLRALGSVVVPIRQVDLVRLRRDDHVYVWDPVASLEFNG
jgi:2'-5' RNA ligase